MDGGALDGYKMRKPLGTFDLSTVAGQAALMARAKELVTAGKKARFKELPQKRSIDQNALSWAVYSQIAKQSGCSTAEEVHRQCKLDIGVPILLEDSQEFRDFYRVGLQPFPYEVQLQQLIKYVDITRLFTTGQFTKYMDTVLRIYSGQGFDLMDPRKDDYADIINR